MSELDGIQGRADIVDVRIRELPPNVNPEALAVSLRSPTKARILSILRHGAPRTKAYIARNTGLSDRALQGHIRALQSAGIIEIHGNMAVSLSFPLPHSMVEIVAYEGKISNWRRALHQALGYRSFSHSVSVVMPAAGAKNASKVAAIFRLNGIGLISVDEDGTNHTHIRSKKRPPASRRLYLMAVGVILSKILEENMESAYSELTSELVQRT